MHKDYCIPKPSVPSFPLTNESLEDDNTVHVYIKSCLGAREGEEQEQEEEEEEK